jgi:hypothetical protein
MLVTGTLFCIAGFVLLLFVHFPVAVLAAFLMALVGSTTIKAVLKGKVPLCPSCRRVPVLR